MIIKSTLDSYSAVLCDAVKKDYIQFGQQCCRENEGEDIRDRQLRNCVEEIKTAL
jgi:hypothetical protein